MNRRRLVYPLIVLAAAAALLLYDRLTAKPPPVPRPLPPVRYDGPLEMRPAPARTAPPAPGVPAPTR